MARIRDLIHEIHRRSLWQVLSIYLVGSWVAIQVVSTLTRTLGLPDWFPPMAVVLLLVGLPIVLATAFVQEGGPGGGEHGEPADGPGDAAGAAAPLRTEEDRGDGSPDGPRSGSGGAADPAGAGTAPPPGVGPLRRHLTWRNAALGGLAGFALWGIVAAGWLVVKGPPESDAAAFLEREHPVRLVVLSFENLGSAQDEYFADGMTEEITARLASLDGLGLIGRTTALKFRDSERSVAEIGQELRVDYVLEGTVRWSRREDAEDRVRVTPQLIRVSDETHVWAEVYEEPLTDVFAVQTDIARKVVNALDVTLLEPERQAMGDRPTDDLEAYDHYLRALDYATHGWTESDLRVAANTLQQAVRLDSTFASAWALLSRVHSHAYWFGYDPTPERAEAARRTAERALRTRPDLATAHLARGLYRYRIHRDYEGAIEHLKRARELQPGNPEIWDAMAAVRRRQGDFEEAVELYRRTVSLDPKSPDAVHSLGSSLFYLRRMDEAARLFHRAVQLRPDWGHVRVYRAWTALARGAAEEARQELERAWVIVQPSPVISSVDDMQPWRLFRVLYRDEPAAGRMPASFFGADSASHHLARAELAELAGDSAVARVHFDSLRSLARSRLEDDPGEALSHSHLALAEAGLGRHEAGLAEARRALELLPPDRDALWGMTMLTNLAWVQVRAGRRAEALESLDRLLRLPSGLTPAWVEIDPLWTPLRENPRYREILEAARRRAAGGEGTAG